MRRQNSIRYAIVVLTGTIATVLTFVWFDWKLFIVLFMWAWWQRAEAKL